MGLSVEGERLYQKLKRRRDGGSSAVSSSSSRHRTSSAKKSKSNSGAAVAVSSSAPVAASPSVKKQVQRKSRHDFEDLFSDSSSQSSRGEYDDTSSMSSASEDDLQSVSSWDSVSRPESHSRRSHHHHGHHRDGSRLESSRKSGKSRRKTPTKKRDSSLPPQPLLNDDKSQIWIFRLNEGYNLVPLSCTEVRNTFRKFVTRDENEKIIDSGYVLDEQGNKIVKGIGAFVKYKCKKNKKDKKTGHYVQQEMDTGGFRFLTEDQASVLFDLGVEKSESLIMPSVAKAQRQQEKMVKEQLAMIESEKRKSESSSEQPIVAATEEAAPAPAQTSDSVPSPSQTPASSPISEKEEDAVGSTEEVSMTEEGVEKSQKKLSRKSRHN